MVIICIENYGTILFSNIRSLPIYLSKIVDLKKKFNQFFIRNFSGIKENLNCFCMTCSSRAYFFIGRILFFSSNVTNRNISYTFNFLKKIFYTPKAATSKYCSFYFRFFRNKIQRDRIHTVPNVFCCIIFTLKNMTQMCSTICTGYFSSNSIRILSTFNSTFNFIIKTWPSTIRFEFIFRSE